MVNKSIEMLGKQVNSCAYIKNICTPAMETKKNYQSFFFMTHVIIHIFYERLSCFLINISNEIFLRGKGNGNKCLVFYSFFKYAFLPFFSSLQCQKKCIIIVPKIKGVVKQCSSACLRAFFFLQIKWRNFFSEKIGNR